MPSAHVVGDCVLIKLNLCAHTCTCKDAIIETGSLSETSLPELDVYLDLAVGYAHGRILAPDPMTRKGSVGFPSFLFFSVPSSYLTFHILHCKCSEKFPTPGLNYEIGHSRCAGPVDSLSIRKLQSVASTHPRARVRTTFIPRPV